MNPQIHIVLSEAAVTSASVSSLKRTSFPFSLSEVDLADHCAALSTHRKAVCTSSDPVRLQPVS